MSLLTVLAPLTRTFHYLWLFLLIYWQMHVHYARLYNLPVLVKEYFNLWRLLHFPEPWELANDEIVRFRAVGIGTIYGVCIMAAIRTVQMAISMLVPMSTHWRILYWDQMLFQNAIPQLNLIYVIITPFCIFYYHRLYFYRGQKRGRYQLETIWLACCVLYRGGDPRYRDRQSPMYVDCARIQKVTRQNEQWLQYWNLYMELAYVYYLFKIFMYIQEHFWYFFTTISGYFSLLVILVNGSIAFIYIYTLLMEYIQNNIVGLVSTLVIFYRMRSIDRLLANVNARKRNFLSGNLASFCRYHTLVLLDIFQTNRLFGPILLSFIIGAVPTSAYQLVLLASKSMSAMTAVNFINLSLYQIGVVFGFHLAAAMYSARIHRCSKRLNQLSASERTGQSVASRFRLSLYIERFHVKKKYGMTYMGYGLVSFSSFFKFTLLYGELLMFGFRWAKRHQEENMVEV